MYSGGAELRNTSAGCQNLTCKGSCHLTRDMSRMASRLNEDMQDHKEDLRPVDDERKEFNCSTSRYVKEKFQPIIILNLISRLINIISKTEEVVVLHMQYHPDVDRVALREGRVLNDFSMAYQESHSTAENDESMTRLRSTCSHMKNFHKTLARATEDFERYINYLKPQSNGSVTCTRSTTEPIVVEDLSQMFADIRQRILDARSIFIRHIEVHSFVNEQAQPTQVSN